MSSIPGLSRLLADLLPRPGPRPPSTRTNPPPPSKGVVDQLTLGLHNLGGVLEESRAALHAAGARPPGSSSGAQAELDAAAQSVRETEDLFQSGGSTDGPGFHVVDVAPDVSSYSVRHVRLHGHPLDVNVVVTQSAQQGGLYLSFGGAALDLHAANSTFTIEIGGRFGARRLTFASGTTLSDVALAINSFGRATGVRASLVSSGATQSNGIKLEGVGFGSDSFASVRVINDGGMSTNGTGLYGLAQFNTNAVATARISDFHSGAASSGFTDHGRDIGGTINGHAAAGHGLTLALQSPSLGTRITMRAGQALGTANAQTLGAMIAFRIEP